MTAELDGVTYCHATPTDDLPITTASTPDDALPLLFGGAGTFVIGHTHHQFDRGVGDLRVRTPIDVERAVAEILESGWPDGEEFVAGNLRAAPSRDEAVAHFESCR